MTTSEHSTETTGARSPNVMVISLDGATWDILLPWMEAGHLPNLQRIAAGGVRGMLQSTVPPVTAPAWTTFQTGMQPGGHGLFHFTHYVPGSYDTELVDAGSIPQKTLWQMLSEAGKRMAAINVPITYPPRPVNGVMVSGLLSPSADQAFWPPELYDTIVDALGEYRIFTPVRSFDYLGVDGFVEEVKSLAEGRALAAQKILGMEDWNFFMVHFQSTDIIQHALWSWADPAHPNYASHPEDEKVKVRGFYETIDRLVGELVEAGGPEQNLIVMSDHGFGPVVKRLYLNQFLLNEGLLSTSVRSSMRMKAVGLLEQFVRRADVFKLRRRLIKPRSRSERFVSRARRDSLIDWSRTKAFALSGPFYGRIYLNTIGREPLGTVERGSAWDALREQIAGKLLALQDPDTGQPIVSQVWRREEIYQGDKAEELPDLVVKPADGYQMATEFRQGLMIERMPDFLSGTHRQEGIVAMTGPHFRPGQELQNASIADMAPTILHLLGLPVPSNMDGSVLLEAMDPEFVTHSPVRFTDEGDSDQGDARSGGDAYGQDDRAEVEARLAGLGYLS